MEPKENFNVSDQLIIGYLKGELHIDETNELVAWTKQDKANKRYFDEFCEIWITSRALLENKGNDYKQGFQKFKEKAGIASHPSFLSRVNTSLLFVKRYAAIVLISFSIGGFLFYGIAKKQSESKNLSFNEIVVPLGAKAEFTLFDGTKVTLNAGSKLKYGNNYGLNERIVQLEGEAYFKVAKDKSRPFIVKTSHVNIRALGTEFNVKAYPDEKTIETTLVEGSVKIGKNNQMGSAEDFILKPNQKLTYYKNRFQASISSESSQPADNAKENREPKAMEQSSVVSKDIDVLPLISWKENRWIIEKQDLLQLSIELERKFDIHIHFESERLKTFRFTGTLLKEPIEQVLTVMSVSAPLTYKIKGKDVTLSEASNFEEVYKNLYQEKK
jgi:transmembrane sensor